MVFRFVFLFLLFLGGRNGFLLLLLDADGASGIQVQEFKKTPRVQDVQADGLEVLLDLGRAIFCFLGTRLLASAFIGRPGPEAKRHPGNWLGFSKPGCLRARKTSGASGQAISGFVSREPTRRPVDSSAKATGTSVGSTGPRFCPSKKQGIRYWSLQSPLPKK